MMLPKENKELDWRTLWASLLQGAGAGLLEHDGSRIAQAALAGLEAFDAAEERRRRRDVGEPGVLAASPWSTTWAEMSPAERAAFLKLSREEQLSYLAELAELTAGTSASDAHRSGGAFAPQALPPLAVNARPNERGRSISPNPFEGSHLQSILPYGPNGIFNIPVFRQGNRLWRSAHHSPSPNLGEGWGGGSER
jgi:hypothetical protein